MLSSSGLYFNYNLPCRQIDMTPYKIVIRRKGIKNQRLFIIKQQIVQFFYYRTPYLCLVANYQFVTSFLNGIFPQGINF